MFRNLTPASKTIILQTGTAAGLTDITEASVDTLGFDSVRFITILGAVTATGKLQQKLQHSDDGSTGWADVAGSAGGGALVSTTSGRALILDVHRPQKRYVRLVNMRSVGAANVAIAAALAELYRPDERPVAAQDATIDATVVLSEPPTGAP